MNFKLPSQKKGYSKNERDFVTSYFLSGAVIATTHPGCQKDLATPLTV